MRRFKTFFLDNQELMMQLQTCNHHNAETGGLSPYHLEGNVFTHTLMVYQSALSHKASDLFLAVAILHDIGKIEARRTQGKRVLFNGHESISFYKALEYKEQILSLFDINEKDFYFSLLPLILTHGDLFRRFDKGVGVVSEADLRILELIFSFNRYDREGSLTTVSNISHSVKTEESYRKNKNSNKPTVFFLLGISEDTRNAYIKETLSPQYKELTIISEKDFLPMLDRTNEDFEQWDRNISRSDVNNQIKKAYDLAISEGRSIVINRANLKIKERKGIFKRSPGHQYKAFLFAETYSDLVEGERDEQAKRRLIEEMKQLTLPYYSERFDEVRIVSDQVDYLL